MNSTSSNTNFSFILDWLQKHDPPVGAAKRWAASSLKKVGRWTDRKQRVAETSTKKMLGNKGGERNKGEKTSGAASCARKAGFRRIARLEILRE